MSNLAGFNVRDFTLTDLVQCLVNSGYVTTMQEVAFANDNNLFKYMGNSESGHKFLVGYDDGVESEYMACMVFVTLGKNGLLCAEYAGMPVFETDDLVALTTYIEQRCN
jgi:hypothetical protein